MRRLIERILPLFAWTSGCVLLAAMASIISYLFYKGAGSLDLSLIFGETAPMDALLMRRQVFEGLFPAMIGTFSLIIISVFLALPLGVATGIYLAEYATGRGKKLLDLVFDILAGLPSIVVGLFGFSLTVFLNRHFSERLHPCLLISSMALAFLVLPYIIRTTQVSLEGLPAETRLTGLALGATKLQNIFRILLPQSLSGMVSGVILAIGRCAEDTAVIMLTGAVASAGVPKSLLSHYEALPFYIYYVSSQYSDLDELSRGYGAAILLLAICLLLFSLAFYVKRRVGSCIFHRG